MKKLFLILLVYICTISTAIAGQKITEIATYTDMNNCYLEASEYIS